MDLDSALTGKPGESASAVELLTAEQTEIRHLLAEVQRRQGIVDAQAPELMQTLNMQLEQHLRVLETAVYPEMSRLGRAPDADLLRAHRELVSLVAASRQVAPAEDEFCAALGKTLSHVEHFFALVVERVYPLIRSADLSDREVIAAHIRRVCEELTGSTEDVSNRS